MEDRDAAIKELEGLIALVNRTWERRGEITPDHEVHHRPAPMAVFKLLPETNCRQCGQPTCFTFALKLVASQVQLADCPVPSKNIIQGEKLRRMAYLPPTGAGRMFG